MTSVRESNRTQQQTKSLESITKQQNKIATICELSATKKQLRLHKLFLDFWLKTQQESKPKQQDKNWSP